MKEKNNWAKIMALACVVYCAIPGAECAETGVRYHQLFRPDAEVASTEQFLTRPLQYLHPHWIPEHIKDKME